MIFNEELNNINAFVSYVKACKEAMRQALIGQEQAVSEEATLDDYAGYISAIEGGGGGIPVYTVQYLDWDGTVLKSEYALTGQTVTPPADPTRESWTFTGWDGSSENIQSDLTITAQYTDVPNTVMFINPFGGIEKTQIVGDGNDATPPTVDWGNVILDSWSDYTDIQDNRVILPTFHILDNKTEITINLDASTGLNPGIYVWPTGGSALIEWGDGTTSTIYSNERVYHQYASYGQYKIKPSRITATRVSLGYTPGGYPDGYQAALVGDYASAAERAVCGTDAVCTGATFIGNSKLADVCLKGFTGNTNDKTFYQCTSLEYLYLENIQTVGYAFCSYCTNLKRVVINSTEVPTLADDFAFYSCHADLKIYVPEILVDAFRAAAEWSNLATRIFPLNDLPNG